MRIFRVITIAALLALGFVSVPAVADAETTVAVRMTTAEVSHQVRHHLRHLKAHGGVALTLPGRERLGDLRGHLKVDLSDLQCSFTELKDRYLLTFSEEDSLTVRASGTDVSTDNCEGVKFHRALSWTVVKGTGAYAGVTGNGTAVGTLRSKAGAHFATSHLRWRGTLVRPR